MSSPLTVADQVAFAYRPDVPVLRQVDLTVEAGEAVALLGPSGSGKSTLIALFAGLLTPSAGDLTVAGRDMSLARNRRQVRRAEVAWVQQSANVLPERSACENVALALRARGARWKAARPRAADALSAVGLAAAVDTPCAKLSGGQTQRVCIARALVTGPALLLADEPTGQLDAATSEVVIDRMFAAARAVSDAAVIIATHDRAAIRHCDRAYVIENGTLVAER